MACFAPVVASTATAVLAFVAAGGHVTGSKRIQLQYFFACRCFVIVGGSK